MCWPSDLRRYHYISPLWLWRMATPIWGYCILVAVMVMASLLATYEKPWGQVSANRTTASSQIWCITWWCLHIICALIAGTGVAARLYIFRFKVVAHINIVESGNHATGVLCIQYHVRGAGDSRESHAICIINNVTATTTNIFCWINLLLLILVWLC